MLNGGTSEEKLIFQEALFSLENNKSYSLIDHINYVIDNVKPLRMGAAKYHCKELDCVNTIYDIQTSLCTKHFRLHDRARARGWKFEK